MSNEVIFYEKIQKSFNLSNNNFISSYAFGNCLSSKKIEVIPLIQITKGLGGKKISYPKWKQAELRFFKVIIYVGGKTPIHTHPAPMVVYLARGELKHTRGDFTNIFSSKQLLKESNNGDEHFVENVGNKTSILYLVAASAGRLPTTINK